MLPRRHRVPSAHLRTCAQGCSSCFVFLAHPGLKPRLRAQPARARTLRGGRKHLRHRGGDKREEGCVWEDGARTPRPGRPHRSPGTASWKAATARSARRSPPGPERHAPTPARSPRPSLRPDCGWHWAPRSGRPGRLGAASPASSRAPPEEPEPPAPDCRSVPPARSLRAGRGQPRGRGAAVSAAATAPSLGPRPRRRSPERMEAGEEKGGGLTTAPH